MKKNKIKQTFAVALCAVLSLSAGGITGYAYSDIRPTEESVQPRYVGITYTYNNLERKSDGLLSCQGATSVLSGYRAGIMVELQQYNGDWNTIKTWSDTEPDYVVIDNDWYVEKGYSYRLKLTHYSFDSNGKLLEVVIKYSKTV